MRIEELAYEWTDIKRIVVTTKYLPLELDGKMCHIKNVSHNVVHLALVSPKETTYHYNWSDDIVAEDTYYPILPKETIGPISLGRVYLKTDSGTSEVVLITKGVK